jgi:hypothetical protein
MPVHFCVDGVIEMQSVGIEPPAADGFEHGVDPRLGVVNAALPHVDQAICEESATRAQLRNSALFDSSFGVHRSAIKTKLSLSLSLSVSFARYVK